MGGDFRKIGQNDGPRILVCCGAGGVGKTTLSAAAALHGAMLGMKTAVLTVDPAKRLGEILGLGPMGNDPERVPEKVLAECNLTLEKGLYVTALDTRRTFDRIVERHSTPQARRHIFQNRYYQNMADTLAGTHEFMAMEKLYELAFSDNFDLLVVDTPPGRRALDFLETPNRLLDLLDHHLFFRLIKKPMAAGFMGLKMAGFMAAPVLHAASGLLGKRALADIQDFISMFDHLFFQGLKKRASAVRDLLSRPDTCFMAVTSPLPGPMKTALDFYGGLEEKNMCFCGFVINRITKPVFTDPPPEGLPAGRGVGGDLMEKMWDAAQRLHQLVQAEEKWIKRLEKKAGQKTVIKKVFRLDHEVADLAALLKIREAVFGTKGAVL